MSSSRNTSGSRRGRQSCGEARTTTDGGTTREGKEYGGTKGRLVHVLQKKPLPFKDLSDQIFDEHDVDQDERYSPHMLGLQLQQVQPTLDVDGITMVDQMQETQTAEQIVDLTTNKLLKNDADVREAFLKLENEEIKIKYMESLLGTYIHGSPCNQVDLLTTSQNHIQSVGMGGITATGANTRDGFMSFLGVHSTALEEPRREPTSFVNLLKESNDDGLV
ncbi:hypothetical protein F2Q69_00050830 [Brassica cretica]|uniref:Uncharacterized protein n=1 Tax=Brassica cretica TaxID=69181 RepID=A0A8S9PMM5_BRACR|nr:hypothetical protein F2Q69_00050830 [Brassica cretica]